MTRAQLTRMRTMGHRPDECAPAGELLRPLHQSLLLPVIAQGLLFPPVNHLLPRPHRLLLCTSTCQPRVARLILGSTKHILSEKVMAELCPPHRGRFTIGAFAMCISTRTLTDDFKTLQKVFPLGSCLACHSSAVRQDSRLFCCVCDWRGEGCNFRVSEDFGQES